MYLQPRLLVQGKIVFNRSLLGTIFMITDADVIQMFGKISSIPHGLPDSKIEGMQRQIFRGNENNFPKGCTRHLQIFERFEVIPKYCFDCYKVVITPRSIVLLFKLLMIFEKSVFPFDIRRKCMVEERDDTSGSYKGFIYCKNIVEGKEIYKIVRKVVSEEISTEVEVTLKRGCSEYARVYPKFAQVKPGTVIMQYKKSWRIHEDYFDKNFTIAAREGVPIAIDDILYKSPDGLTEYTRREIYCIQYWLRYAATIGDTSYLAITGVTIPPIPNLKRPSSVHEHDSV